MLDFISMKARRATFRGVLALFAVVASSLVSVAPSSVAAQSTLVQRSFSAGVSSTCALRAGNSIFCVGDNTYAQLGDGNRTSSSEPKRVALLDSALSVTVGKSFGCAIGTNELGYCWGTNSTGQLGQGPRGLFFGGPYASQISTEEKLADIQAGDEFACALTKASKVLCWGGVAQLTGLEQAEAYPTDMNIAGATAIAVGPTNFCYIKNSVYCIGSAPYSSTAQIIPETAGATDLAVGKDFGCAVVSKGVKCWGENTKGQLGQGNTTAKSNVVQVTGLNDIKSVTAGYHFACALSLAGASFCWGDNSSNQVSSGGEIQNLRVPTAIPNAVSIDAGSNFLCALLTNGSIKCVGDNSKGQSGTVTSSSVPIGPIYQSGFTRVATGGATTCTIDRSAPEQFAGNLSCWGELIPNETENILFTDVAIGDASACAITVAGVVRCWGSNSAGQLGDGSNKSAITPTVVSGFGLYKAKNIAAGYRHFCANTTDGLVLCWGDDSRQQLGYVADGTNGVSKVAIAVAGIGNALSVSAGLYHSCALVTGGSVQCWGDNSKKQILNNSTARVGVTLVTQSGAVTKVASGGYVNCFLLTDSSVNCIGENTDLQAPGSLSGTYTDLAVGLNSVCLTKTMGNRVACFGSNTNTKLGRVGLKSATPSDVASLSAETAIQGFRIIAVGEEHACTIGENTFLYCWGLNTSGQLASSFGFPSAFAEVVVSVSGKANVGDTLSTTVSGSEPYAQAKYSWFKASDEKSAGLAVSGSTGVKYVPAVSDLNRFFSSGVTLTKWGVTSSVFRSAYAGPVAKATRILITSVPTISGETKVGRLLIVRSGAWESSTKFTYQWYRGTTKVGGATKAVYKLGAADVGQQISVWVTGSKTGLPKVVKKSLKTKKIAR